MASLPAGEYATFLFAEPRSLACPVLRVEWTSGGGKLFNSNAHEMLRS